MTPGDFLGHLAKFTKTKRPDLSSQKNFFFGAPHRLLVKKITRIAVSQNSTRLPFFLQAGDPQKVVAGGCANKWRPVHATF
jgi:hypothetical protein